MSFLAITKEKKQALLAAYLDKASRAHVLIITEHRGLTVKQAQELRRSLAQHQATFHVVKNTLFRRALREIGRPVPDSLLNGPTAVSYCFGDVAAVAKVVDDFARTSGVLQIRGGLLGSQVVDVEGIRALANLPPREVLLARVVGGIQAPLVGLVTVLGGVLRGLVNVLDARRRQLEEAAA